MDEQEIKQILSNFPKIELSYETMMHKKVLNADIIMAIPEGNKFFAWFTSYKKNNVLHILETSSDFNVKQIKNIEIAVTSFSDKLALGTILYGTIFSFNKSRCFSIEDIFYYKGKNISQSPFLEKLNVLKYMLSNDICQNALVQEYMIFGLPFMSRQFNSFIKEVELLPYKVTHIHYRYYNNNKLCLTKYFKPGNNYKDQTMNQLKNAIFKVTPDIQNDIYNLFIYKNGKEEFYDLAFIPDYKTSVFMNKLFRNIKENNNLDALEESDDESEFENFREDKYVYLDRSFKMNCQYNAKFKKWVPVSLASKHDKIISSLCFYKSNQTC
jgi:hypothetical protein